MKAHRLNDVRNNLSLDEGFRRRQRQMPIVANSGQSAMELLVGNYRRTRARTKVQSYSSSATGMRLAEF
jgi:hypothetical protein